MYTALPNRPDWQALLKSGSRIFLGSNAAVPNGLIDDLIARAQGLHDIEVVHINTLSESRWVEPQYSELFKVNTLFINGDKIRKAVAEGRADYTPCFLSEVPSLFEQDILPLDAALVMVSPPDKYGYCSLGVAVDVTLAAVRKARHVIAQINPMMPRTSGYSHIHVSELSACLELPQVLPQLPEFELDKKTERIGQYVSMLVEDGATLQLGVGKIPNAVLRYLQNHKDLGVHSELITDGIIDLLSKGVINNRRKTFHPGKTVTSFCLGSKALYDFVDGNPHVEFYPSDYVNSPSNIARNHKMVAINSALEVDLTGQVVADSIGYQFYSGIGGQVDFIRGAAMAPGASPLSPCLPLPETVPCRVLCPPLPKAAGWSPPAVMCIMWSPNSGWPHSKAAVSASGPWSLSVSPIRIFAPTCWPKYGSITGCPIIRKTTPVKCRSWDPSASRPCISITSLLTYAPLIQRMSGVCRSFSTLIPRKPCFTATTTIRPR
ncbi:hypothetical protein GCM10027098_32780 [Bowmanella dokdonensis]